ncbi:gluconate 2-dehydrogenase subunit 3 family protein [Gluconacetobacter sp. Hr-1-5]|uniref:gluconate 2-dehydrogenase subunit 3 family protein n=1 Tax=Gluconacetobacter sp. Hr-1-5 TaxID=3395370 RepID=UPI003B521EBC
MIRDRRNFLKVALVTPTALATDILPATSSSKEIPATSRTLAAGNVNAARSYSFLRPAEADFVEAVADHMVPADTLSPSGTDIGIPAYIDRALGGAWGSGEGLYLGGPWGRGTPSQGYQLPLTPAELFRSGHEIFSKYIFLHHKKTFERMDFQEKESTLNDLFSIVPQLAPEELLENFSSLLYQLVIEGLFSDPVHGGNHDKAGWKLVGFPGVVATHTRHVVDYLDKPLPIRDYFSISDIS